MNVHSDASGLHLRRFTERNLVTLARLVLDTAFQPIVEVSTGFIYGCEALMRGHERLGFASPVDLIEAAVETEQLAGLETFLMGRALAKMASAEGRAGALLFLNFDMRLLAAQPDFVDRLVHQIRLLGLQPASVCFELPERFDHSGIKGFAECIARLRRHGFKLAVDDFGAGYGELRVLADVPVDFVKIDRSLVTDLETRPRRRHVLRHMVNVAHALGARVIAEGVETASGFTHCREAGCDFVQGWFFDPARLDLGELPRSYADQVRQTVGAERSATLDEMLIRQQVERLPTIQEGDGIEALFDLFKSHPHQAFFPVVDRTGQPLGIVHERQIKSIIYQPYGRDLIKNKSSALSIFSFLTHVPIARLDFDTRRLLDLFASMNDSDCLILTENSAYVGVLSATSLIRILNEKQVKRAREANPLTGLPGNGMIGDHVRQTLSDGHAPRFICYCDFDHFKPFNDVYGFQQGDMAISIFASLLRQHFVGSDTFIGHVGGDDFFLGTVGGSRDEMAERLTALLSDFRDEVALLYSERDREAGHILSTDRYGETRKYALLRCSVAVLELPEGFVCSDPEGVGPSIARLKRAAKAAETGLAFDVMTFGPDLRA